MCLRVSLMFFGQIPSSKEGAPGIDAHRDAGPFMLSTHFLRD